MPGALPPHNEELRLRALLECEILDTAPEVVFDDLTEMAARLCAAPISLVSLVDENRQWFKSACGLDATETPREQAFCGYAIHGTEPFIVQDARQDERTLDNPLVTGPPHIRSYAGVPLLTSDGFPLGTLCVIDTQPRIFTEHQLEDLKALSRQASTQLELRRTVRKLDREQKAAAETHERLVQVSRQVPGFLYQYLQRPDGSSCLPYASEGIRDVYRVAPEDVRDDASIIFERLHPDDLNEVVASVEESARTLEPWRREYRIRFEDGETRWVLADARPTRQPDGSTLWHGFLTDVTQQRNDRHESQRTRSYLQAVVDASTQVAIIATDLDGVVTIFNTGAEQMLGYTAEEMVGKQTPALIHLESEVVERGEQLTRETGRAVHGFDAFVEYARQGRHDAREWTYIHKDGSRLTVDLVVTSIRDSDNALIGFLGVASDVTSARLYESQMLEQNAWFRQMTASLPLLTWTCHSDGFCDYLSKQWVSYTGIPEEEQLGTGWLEQIHPADRDATFANWEEHVSTGSPLEIQYRLRGHDGNYRWFQTRAVPIRDGDGQIVKWLGSSTDIQDIRNSEERFELAVRGSSAGLWDWDITTGHVFYAPRFKEMLGCTEEEFPNQIGSFFDAVHPDDREEVQDELRAHLAGETTTYDVEHRLRTRSGDYRYFHANGAAVRDENDQPCRMAGSLVDITDRKRVEIELRAREQELIAAHAEAEAANRSKTDFLANMSHEIRTPLTAILGYAHMLSESDVTDEERRSCVDTIRSSGSHLLTVISDILDLSKIEAGQMTVERVGFIPARLVEEVLAFFEEPARIKGLTLSAHIHGRIPLRICSDPVRIRQILINLLGNSIKFTEHGSVRLTLRLLTGDSSAPDDTGPLLAFDVSDTGIGLSQEQQQDLFEPFVQADASTRRKYGGTGLGLTICRRMARLLDGDVSITSELGKGSTFTATVATGSLTGVELIDRLAAGTEKAQVSFVRAPKLQARILLAEDNPVNQRLISTLLQRAGATVDVVDNGEQALQRILAGPRDTSRGEDGESGTSYDLVLMDMQMPVLDGCSATIRLREQGVTIPILALTANAMEDDRKKCLEAGCNDFFTKPLDRIQLITACSEWITRSRPQPVSDITVMAAPEPPVIAVPEAAPEPASPASPAEPEHDGVPEPVTAQPPEPPAFDESELRKLVDNNVELLESMIQLFVTESRTSLECTRLALADGNHKEVASTIHRLKGALAAVHGLPSIQVVERMEQATRLGDQAGMALQLAELQYEVERLCTALTEFVGLGTR